MLKIGFLIYTYDRVDDAKVNMELIQNLWQKTKLVDEVKIIHAYNGKKQLYPEKYLEDRLVVIKNSGHFQGAAELIDSGIEAFKKNYNYLDYIVVLAADTWLIKTDYLLNVLKEMSQNKLYLAASSWGSAENNSIFEKGMSVDFFVVDFKWSLKYKFFPINYQKFYDKYWDLLLYFADSNLLLLEKLAFAGFLKATFEEKRSNVDIKNFALSKLRRLKEREPVFPEKDSKGHFVMKKYWPKMGLVTYHNPRHKQAILKTIPNLKGEHIGKLIKSKNPDYFSKGAAGTKPKTK